jgi:hypothetical protein
MSEEDTASTIIQSEFLGTATAALGLPPETEKKLIKLGSKSGILDP